jgi:8-oxo-dGTP diphosphatase
MENEEKRVKVGIGVMIFKDGKVLLGKRKSKLAQGDFAFPGGHLEYMESFEECARRETREEAGIEIKNIRFNFLGNFKAYAPKHYVQIDLIADWASGEPKAMEPEKMESWSWYSLDNLPSPLFKTIPQTLEAYRTGRNYFDA